MIRRTLGFFSIALALLAGCQNGQTVDAPLAPSTVPIAAASPAAMPSPTAAPTSGSPTAAPLPTSIAATEPPATAPPDQAPAPTTIVPPADPLQVPDGFGVGVFQAKLRGPRMLALGPDGAIYAAERGAGRVVRLPDRDGDGLADGVEPVADNLDAPSSLAFFEDGSLYVAETTRVLRLGAPDGQGVFGERATVIDGLPDGGHNTRTLLFSPDWSTLYVSVGSSCNVCAEDDERRASIMAYSPDGSGGRVHAKGLRNAVGLAWRPGGAELWATNNGRDLLGDDQPPETVNAVTGPGLDFGWPRCHADRISDPEFGGAQACDGVAAPAVEMQAHSAPLGLAFGAATAFPEPYRSGLFVAFHGSWNRSEPTGYKVVFIPLDGDKAGPVRDFAAGWLKADGTVWGRPVDVLAGADGSLYVSDDAGGVIYRIFRK
ncbi:MAG TPA: PQQ-dependent sugar dehydrogenase [Herpetosiphonaceae bacterium]|nr:PQQ-dependent sugar dehydrogenase [Herpetosiphonaceae bacterium]